LVPPSHQYASPTMHAAPAATVDSSRDRSIQPTMYQLASCREPSLLNEAPE
jgi:hypothetical protein